MAELADLCGVSYDRAQRWVEQGMPVKKRGQRIRLDKALRWLLNHLPSDHRDGGSEQPTAVRRVHMTDVVETAMGNLVIDIGGAANRLATAIAATDDPAKVRQLVNDENSDIRARHMEALQRIFDADEVSA
ncbi:MAG: hypothetical protein U5O39_03380 [Gammaproteobacteria bacterium]|nr:hypothetical protein [Gammaproteobacteria bacterium]